MSEMMSEESRPLQDSEPKTPPQGGSGTAPPEAAAPDSPQAEAAAPEGDLVQAKAVVEINIKYNLANCLFMIDTGGKDVAIPTAVGILEDVIAQLKGKMTAAKAMAQQQAQQQQPRLVLPGVPPPVRNGNGFRHKR